MVAVSPFVIVSPHQSRYKRDSFPRGKPFGNSEPQIKSDSYFQKSSQYFVFSRKSTSMASLGGEL